MTPDVGELLDLAVAAARRAGTLLIDARPARLAVDTKSTPTDVVTAMDRAAERLIVDIVRSARPDDAVLGEEGGASGGGSTVRWVIDPIDGTVNYLYGIPHWTVSIAVEVGGEPAVGVVFDAPKDELYVATHGGGATRNGERIHVGSAMSLDQALVATGFGYAAERRAAQARVLAALLPRVRDIRRFGAASLDLCDLACGRVDGYYERGLARWDLAAGQLIAVEAGALVGGLRGAVAGPNLVVGANPTLFGALHDLLAELAADRD